VIGIAKQHHTWGLIEQSNAFALHLVDEGQLEWVWRFGLASGHDQDKLSDLKWHRGQSGAPILDEAPAWLDCRVEARLDTGDRTVYLASVIDARPLGPQSPMMVERMLELAPGERRAELRRQMARDTAIDGAAIEAWRRSQRPHDPEHPRESTPTG
jgi:hypothetical protein